MAYRVIMLGACPFPVPQGSQALLQEVARAVQAAGHAVRVCVYGHGAGLDPGDLEVVRAARVPGYRKTAAGPAWGKPLADALLLRRLRRLAADFRPDVVHAHNHEALAVALAADVAPVVYHAHTLMAGELPSFTGGLPGAGRLGRTLDRALPPRAAAAIALNERMAAALRDAGLPPERVFTVPPPVDTRPFGPPPERHGLAPVAYTGNLDAYQNIGLLERAVERARESEPALAFLVATGDKATPRGAERVASAGFADVCALLRRDVVLACPRTAWPGYPIKLANGLAAGSAIVACEGAAHGLEHGRTALVVPDDDAAAFAGALLRAARDPALRGRLGRAARAHAEEHLAPARVAAQVTGAYAAACG